MKLVIYRDKMSNKITLYHEVTATCTAEKLQCYNDNESHTSKAEIVELDEIAEYFYKLKTSTIKDEAENLRDIMDELSSIANRIDDRLYDFDRWYREERGDE